MSDDQDGECDQGSSPACELSTLVGRTRARILLELDEPTTAGELAGALALVPSVTTYHLAVLERAGLVYRAPAGRYVTIGRTGRGKALLELYGPPARIEQ